MRLSSAVVLVVSLGLMLAGAASPAAASSIVIGGSDTYDFEPFGFDHAGYVAGAGEIFQQIYNGDAFGTAPVLIDQLTFFIDLDGPQWQGHMFYSGEQLFLSTSPQSVGSPSAAFAAASCGSRACHAICRKR